MHHMKEEKIPASVKTILDFVTCDICRERIKTGIYEVAEVMVIMETGSRYPEGGSGVKTEVDLCVACFKNKLLPWLDSQGVQPRVKEWDC